MGIILGQGLEDQLASAFGQEMQHLFRELADRVFLGVARVDDGDEQIVLAAEVLDHGALELHEGAQRIDQIVHVLEAARLAAIPVDGDRPLLQRLHDEIADHAAVLRMHVGSVGVEDAHHADIDAVFPAVVDGQRLGGALPLVVAAPRADAVHMAPVGFALRMLEGVAVDFGRRGVEDARLGLERQFQHVHHPDEGGLDGFDGVALIVDRRGGTGQVVDLVELPPEGLRHIMQNEGEAAVVQQIVDVGLGAREEVVEYRDLVVLGQQATGEVRADEPRAASDECFACHDNSPEKKRSVKLF